MRTPWLARVMFLVAVAGCDQAALDEVDAALAVDAGADADADATVDVAPAVAITPTAAPRAIAHELPSAPMLSELTGLSGELGMIVGIGDGAATGAITRAAGAGDDGAVVLRRGHRLGQDEAALIGTTVALHQADGLACTATIRRLVEVAAIIPSAEHDHGDRTLWRVAEERAAVQVVAELVAPGCDDPIAVDDRAERGPVAAPRMIAAEAPVAVEAMARLRALPQFAAVQAAYRAEPYDYEADHPDWSESAELTVAELTLAGTAYVTAELHRDGECGHFGATVFAIWQRPADGAARLVLVTDRRPDGYDLAFDADRDGVPELAAISTTEPIEEEPVYDGCGC